METPSLPDATVTWTGRNTAEVQAFVGIMSNMDGDASTPRFLPPEALDDEGERIWEDPRARLWVEEIHHWVSVDVGDRIINRNGRWSFGIA